MVLTKSETPTSIFKGLLPGFIKVNNRPLSHMDIEYFDNTFAPLNCVFPPPARRISRGRNSSWPEHDLHTSFE